MNTCTCKKSDLYLSIYLGGPLEISSTTSPYRGSHVDVLVGWANGPKACACIGSGGPVGASWLR
eukprot:scaffold60818_cov28-Tisochrysis_lutea.AAC.2